MGTFFTEERDGWIRDALAAQTKGWRGVTQKPMMGCACFWAAARGGRPSLAGPAGGVAAGRSGGGRNGQRLVMFAFVANGCVVLTKLTPEEKATVRGEPFWTGSGRPPIRKWVQVRIGEPVEVRELKPLLRACYERAKAEEAPPARARADQPAPGRPAGGRGGLRGAHRGSTVREPPSEALRD